MLQGKKVVLREMTVGDALQDYAWRCDPELARLDAVQPLQITFEEYLRAYEEELQYPAVSRVRFAIDTLEGKHIGDCMYYGIDHRRGEAELGVLIGDREYWSQGYGADAITTLVDHAFGKIGLKRIYLNTLDWNQRAQRCFAKCGFVTCGRRDNGEHTFVVMELFRCSWEQRQKAPQPGEKGADKN